MSSLHIAFLTPCTCGVFLIYLQLCGNLFNFLHPYPLIIKKENRFSWRTRDRLEIKMCKGINQDGKGCLKMCYSTAINVS